MGYKLLQPPRDPAVEPETNSRNKRGWRGLPEPHLSVGQSSHGDSEVRKHRSLQKDWGTSQFCSRMAEGPGDGSFCILGSLPVEEGHSSDDLRLL